MELCVYEAQLHWQIKPCVHGCLQEGFVTLVKQQMTFFPLKPLLSQPNGKLALIQIGMKFPTV